jgi:hypothetical protein
LTKLLFNYISMDTSSLLETSTQYCCNVCGKSYVRKLSLERHKLLCEFLSKSKHAQKVELQEEPDLPSYAQLVNIVQELAIKYNKQEQEIAEMRKWINKKKKKINIISWLNTHNVPNNTYVQWAMSLVVSETLFEYLIGSTLLQTIQLIFETNLVPSENMVYPIKCFQQKSGYIYIYVSEDEGWREMTAVEFIKLLRVIQSLLLDRYNEWKLKYAKELEDNERYMEISNKLVGKMLSLPLTPQDHLFTKMKSGLFHYLKTDLKFILEYDFEF